MADETQVTDEMIAEVLRLDRASTPGPWGNPLVQDGELLPDGNGYLGDWEPDNLSVVRLAGRENAEQNVADCDRPVDAALHEARGRSALPGWASAARAEDPQAAVDAGRVMQGVHSCASSLRTTMHKMHNRGTASTGRIR